MRSVNVAVLGACGWMGKVHSGAYRRWRGHFEAQGAELSVAWLVDQDLEQARGMAATLGGGDVAVRVSEDWRDAVQDPKVDLVDICLPDNLHHEIAKAALSAGKHVYCEKPLTDTGDQARELVALAKERGLVTRVGYSFAINPAHRLAREIIDSGEIGQITLFRGTQHVDTHGSPDAPFIWRLDGDLAPTGIVGDTGSHVFSLMDYLAGEVDELIAHCPTIFAERPDVPGAVYGGQASAAGATTTRAVTNPDLGMLMCKFASGALGTVDFSRIATGKRFMQRYEIYGSKGSVAYDYDEITRLHVFSLSDASGRQGYRAIDVGPERPEYAAFLPLANFGLGYNELKEFETREVVESVLSGKTVWPTFDDGQRMVAMVDACMASHAAGGWVKVRNR